jgi:hypothetical protein
MNRFYSLAFVLCAAITAVAAYTPTADAHPGGTNADGCHTNRTTGAYHCHNRKRPDPERITYCHIVNGDARCGYAYSTCQDLAGKFGGQCRKE